MTWQVIGTIVGGVVIYFILSAIVYHLQSQQNAIMLSESTEAVDGERTMLANSVLQAIQYWLQDIGGDPLAASSPDSARSYIKIPTVEGYVQAQFNWRTNRVHVYYARHSLEEGCAETRRLTLRIRHGAVNEIKLGKFISDIHDLESENVKRKVFDSNAFKTLVQSIMQSAGDSEKETENGGE